MEDQDRTVADVINEAHQKDPTKESDPFYAITDTEEARDFLRTLGIEPSQTNLRQLAVFSQAMTVYAQRNDGRYKDLWKSRGWRGALFHMDSKMLRSFRQFWEGGTTPEPWTYDEVPNTDDVVDLMNYAAFFMRCVQEGNEYGAR